MRKLLHTNLVLLACVSIAFILSFQTPIAAQSNPDLKLDVTLLYDGNVIEGTWLPVKLQLQNGAGDRTVQIDASLLDSAQHYTQEIALPAQSNFETTLYILPVGNATTLDIVVREGERELVRSAPSYRTRVGERMLALVSNEPIAITLPARQDLSILPFLPFDLQVSDLPERSQGLETLSAIVLHNVDSNQFTTSQLEALETWVKRGGQLVLSGGTGSSAQIANLPSELVPAQIVGVRSDLPGEALAELIGITNSVGLQLNGVGLQAKSDSSILIGDEANPLVIEKRLGEGHIHQLAFAVDAPELRNWNQSSQFWDRFLRPTNPDSAITGFVGSRLIDARERELTTSLNNLPALDLPSGLPLIALLTLYFLIVGPIVHVVLRRLDKQNWGWLIIPGITVLFSLISYGFSFALRASDVLVNQVTVIEQVAAHNQAKTLLGFYGSKRNEFTVTFQADSLLRPLRSVSGVYGDVSGSNGNYLQGNPAIADIQSNAWSIQGIQAETELDLPQIDATITIQDGAIRVRVPNPLDQTMRNVVVRYGQQVVVLGDIPPGQQAESAWIDPKVVDANGLPPAGSSLGSIIFRQALEEGRKPGAIPDRSVVLKQTMLDAVLSNGALPQSPGPTLVAWLDTSPVGVEVESNSKHVLQATTLFIAQPKIEASGLVQLGPGWLNLDYAGNTSAIVCSNNNGLIGLTPSTTTELLFRLPNSLNSLEASRLILSFSSLRTWPNAGIRTALYNWETDRWDELDYDGPGDLLVDQAKAYLREGKVAVRFEGRIAETGCIFGQGSLTGRIP